MEGKMKLAKEYASQQGEMEYESSLEDFIEGWEVAYKELPTKALQYCFENALTKGEKRAILKFIESLK